jgi:hypothetical protein
MKTRNEAALEALDKALIAENWGEVKRQVMNAKLLLQNTLTHEDAPVGEVGDDEEYDVVLELMPEYHADWTTGEDGEDDVLREWFKNYEHVLRKALRTHSQQKDVYNDGYKAGKEHYCKVANKNMEMIPLEEAPKSIYVDGCGSGTYTATPERNTIEYTRYDLSNSQQKNVGNLDIIINDWECYATSVFKDEQNHDLVSCITEIKQALAAIKGETK